MKSGQTIKRPSSSERLNVSKSSRLISMEDYLIAQNTFPDFFYQKNEDGRPMKGWKKSEREQQRLNQSRWKNGERDISIVEWYRKEYGMK